MHLAKRPAKRITQHNVLRSLEEREGGDVNAAVPGWRKPEINSGYFTKILDCTSLSSLATGHSGSMGSVNQASCKKESRARAGRSKKTELVRISELTSFLKRSGTGRTGSSAPGDALRPVDKKDECQ